MSITSSWLILLVRSSVSLQIFCLLVLSITERGVLKSPTLIVDMFISPFSSVIFCLMYFKALVFDAHT